MQFCVSVVWEQAGGAGIHLLLAAPVIALNAMVWFKFKTIREFRTACNGIAIGIFAETGTGIVLLFSRSTQLNQVLHLWLPAITTVGLVYILSYIYSKETASIADF